jgi:hypothetical protein
MSSSDGSTVCTLISTASLVTFIAYPVTLIAFGIRYLHSKRQHWVEHFFVLRSKTIPTVHFNNPLATLNSRKALMEKLGGVVTADTPQNNCDSRYGSLEALITVEDLQFYLIACSRDYRSRGGH